MANSPGRGSRWGVLAVIWTLALSSGAAFGQAIPRDEYLRYMPLHYPALVGQARANEQFHLFGDRADPAYRDVAPVDGIDDRRQELLRGLGARFGPIMVMNTTNLPMDFRRFMDQSQSFNLFVDTWSLLGNPPELVRSDMVNLHTVVDHPCDADDKPDRRYDPSGDCLLMDMLARFDPREPDYQALNPRSVAPDSSTFQVMFFDWPGVRILPSRRGKGGSGHGSCKTGGNEAGATGVRPGKNPGDPVITPYWRRI